jgi:hypothetical protein
MLSHRVGCLVDSSQYLERVIRRLLILHLGVPECSHPGQGKIRHGELAAAAGLHEDMGCSAPAISGSTPGKASFRDRLWGVNVVKGMVEASKSRYAALTTMQRNTRKVTVPVRSRRPLKDCLSHRFHGFKVPGTNTLHKSLKCFRG